MTTTGSRERVVSGMRPTGKLHLGHYHGVLQNWVRLQDQYDCYFFVADWHALTTEYAQPGVIRDSIHELLADWLACGLDPDRAVLFIQSHVKEHAELHLLLSMITPLSWLERVPSFKEMQEELVSRDLSTHGFLGYPVLQVADIALYDGKKVPVGADQVPHIELAREVVRRFNSLYKKTLIEPEALLTHAPKLLGPDRRKMSKSYDNCLYLSDGPKEIEKKVSDAITDPARVRREDPGHPEICLIFDYHRLHSAPEKCHQVERDCRSAALGCVEDKRAMAKILDDFLAPIRAKRHDLLAHPKRLEEIARAGCEKAEAVARETIGRVREAMKI